MVSSFRSALKRIGLQRYGLHPRLAQIAGQPGVAHGIVHD